MRNITYWHGKEHLSVCEITWKRPKMWGMHHSPWKRPEVWHA